MRLYYRFVRPRSVEDAYTKMDVLTLQISDKADFAESRISCEMTMSLWSMPEEKDRFSSRMKSFLKALVPLFNNTVLINSDTEFIEVE